MKAKYLIDENVSLGKEAVKNNEILQTKDVLGEGKKDAKLFDYITKNNLILVTNDKRFSLKTAIENHPVRFHDRDTNKTYQLYAKETDEIKKFSDSTTFYILENDQVVIP